MMMNLRKWNWFLILIFVTLSSIVHAEDSLGTWIQFQSQVSKERMLRNISPSDAVPGIVIASPSRQAPDYRYHWTRDSSLVMDQVVWLFRDAPDTKKDTYLKYLYSYIHLNPVKLIDKNWKENKNTVDLLKYVFSYPYSSLKEYRDNKFKIVNPSQFPSYFKNPADHKKELWEWLSFENT